MCRLTRMGTWRHSRGDCSVDTSLASVGGVPGIYGSCGVSGGNPLEATAQALQHFAWHVRPPPTSMGPVRGGCVALGAPFPTARTVEVRGAIAWIHGELYGTSDVELVEAMFARDAGPRLARINGNYAIAAWHPERQLLRLATDRLGLRHLYWARSGRGVVWASEAKACALALPSVELRSEAPRELVEVGHLRGLGTWFVGVELMPPATLLELELSTERVSSERYWAWPASPPSLPDAEVSRITRRLAERWQEIHEMYTQLPGRSMLTLSGGLDSRAILAAFRAARGEPGLVTFGRPACLDVTIARETAAAAGLPHVWCELSGENWLDDREEATWITDGEFDLRHMHVVRCLPRCREVGDVALNGFLGDALIGGGYLSPRWTTEERYRERGRRFISGGTRLGESYLLHRLPFCDNEMVELSLALPEQLRRGAAYYRRFLVTQYPGLFARIGHTPHGARLSANVVTRTVSAASHWLRDRYDYHAYARWVTEPSVAARLEPHLDPSRARFVDVVDEQVWAGPVRRWRARRGRRSLGARDCDLVLRFVGIDIWLQHVARRMGARATQRDAA
ncbi:MAG: asparagine synthase-related protein [Kofleriaceae bacterium]|nr:asparagine synthase-related protein [Kofleriaceae bacterium]